MRKKPIFIKNAVILTASSIVLRLLGVAFKVWAAARIGGEGMGVYGLIISVYWLFCAFAGTGVSVAVTRLCADCISLKRDFRPVMRKAFVITAVCAVCSCGIMFAFSPYISKISIGKSEYSLCFKMLSFSIIPVGISGCLRGFFFAVRKPGTSAFSQILEQVVRIAFSCCLVVRFARRGIAAACLALSAGDCVAETVCAVFLMIVYKLSIKKFDSGLPKFCCEYKKVLRISFPLTAGKYFGLALRTCENIMVPKGLVKSGLSSGKSLEFFGNIKAMALPVLLFPSGFLGAVSALLVPELSSSLAKGRRLVVKEICEKTVKLCCVVAIISSCVFAFCGSNIGLLLYKNATVGSLLCILAPIVPLMYIDIVCDGLLKGLDCQKFSFFCGVSDCVIRLVLVFVFLPKYGVTAFVFIMYFSNVYTCALNIGMLIKKIGGGIDTAKTVFLPLVFALLITKTAKWALSCFINNNLLFVCAFCAVSFICYFVCLFASGCITPGEIKDTLRRG